MLLTSYIQAKNKGESGSKAQSYYSAEQARESGTLGTCSLRKVQLLQLFCFNYFIKYKNFSQKVMIELWSYALVGVVVSILHCDILEGLVLALSMAILFHLPES